jgi:hypothetical protein
MLDTLHKHVQKRLELRDIKQVAATLRICDDLLAIANTANSDLERIQNTYAIEGKDQE